LTLNRVPKEVSTTILLTVYRSGRLTMSELYGKTKFSTITILNHVNALIKSGLMEEEREEAFPKRRVVKVSEEGRKVASLLNIADACGLGAAELVEMGAKAGRVASYQEVMASLRRIGVTREQLVAELLLKGVSAISASLALVAAGIPDAEEAAAFRSWGARLEKVYGEGLKRLHANNVTGCIDEVSRGLAEFSRGAAQMRRVAEMFRERRLDDIANCIDFLIPKPTQKE